MKWRQIVVGGLVCAAVAGVILWVLHARLVGQWLQVHTGTINESGPYYGFWSGFGSDIAEFGILGAIGTGLWPAGRRAPHAPSPGRTAARLNPRCSPAATRRRYWAA